MAESYQKKLEKTRKPRVHIKYDIETEGATVEKELPFVVGVMGDFSGDATEPQKGLKDRKFTQIDADNFDKVMKSMHAGLKYRVENTLEGDGSELPVDLTFESMDDFDPEKLVQQIEPLKKLVETRQALNDLLTKADRSQNLEDMLENILQNTDSIKGLAKELGEPKKSE